MTKMTMSNNGEGVEVRNEEEGKELPGLPTSTEEKTKPELPTAEEGKHELELSTSEEKKKMALELPNAEEGKEKLVLSTLEEEEKKPAPELPNAEEAKEKLELSTPEDEEKMRLEIVLPIPEEEKKKPISTFGFCSANVIDMLACADTVEDLIPNNKVTKYLRSKYETDSIRAMHFDGNDDSTLNTLTTTGNTLNTLNITGNTTFDDTVDQTLDQAVDQSLEQKELRLSQMRTVNYVMEEEPIDCPFDEGVEVEISTVASSSYTSEFTPLLGNLATAISFTKSFAGRSEVLETTANTTIDSGPGLKFAPWLGEDAIEREELKLKLPECPPSPIASSDTTDEATNVSRDLSSSSTKGTKNTMEKSTYSGITKETKEGEKSVYSLNTKSLYSESTKEYSAITKDTKEGDKSASTSSTANSRSIEVIGKGIQKEEEKKSKSLLLRLSPKRKKKEPKDESEPEKNARKNRYKDMKNILKAEMRTEHTLNSNGSKKKKSRWKKAVKGAMGSLRIGRKKYHTRVHKEEKTSDKLR